MARVSVYARVATFLHPSPRLVERDGAVGRGGDRDGDGGRLVERVYLVPNLLRHALVLNLLQAGAVDIPDAGLRDVSQPCGSGPHE